MTATLDAATRLKLYQLYRNWPGRIEHRGKAVEALLFQSWLGENHSEAGLDPAQSTVSSIREFLHQYRHVLTQHHRHSPETNLRQDPRIDNQVGVLLRVARCADKKLLGFSTRGNTLDLCRHGMRVKADIALPEKSEVDIVVTPRGLPVTFYNLSGELRWAVNQAKALITGIQLGGGRDFTRWEDDFSTRFGTGTVAA